MSPNLPKPPPKAPPRAVPGAALATPAAPVPAPAAAPSRPAQAAAPARPAPATGAKVVPITAATPAPPVVDTTGMPASMAAMAVAVKMFDDVLIEENLLLRAHDTKGVAALQDRKQAASRLYQERLRSLLRDGQALAGLAEEQRRRMVDLAKAMEARAEENASLLKAHMDAIERLFETINSAVLHQKNADVTYSRKGTVTGSLTTSGSAIAYNTTI